MIVGADILKQLAVAGSFIHLPIFIFPILNAAYIAELPVHAYFAIRSYVLFVCPLRYSYV